MTNKQRQLTKGDLLPADRILNRVFTTLSQWNIDAEQAKANELIDFVVCEDGGCFEPTQRYIDMKDQFGWAQ